MPEPDARTVLATVIDALDHDVIVHCCAPNPPLTLLREAGATAIALDATLISGKESLDELGETWQAGTSLALGLVPSTDPGRPVTLKDVGQRAFTLVDRLGFPAVHPRRAGAGDADVRSRGRDVELGEARVVTDP